MPGGGGQARGYEQTLDWVVSLLGGLAEGALEARARRLGLHAAGGALCAAFLGREYRISRAGVALTAEHLRWSAGDTLEYNIKSVLGYYALSEADVTPAGAFCPLSHFSHGIFRNDGVLSADKLSAAFSADYTLFKSVAEKLGMTDLAEKTAGRHAWSYLLLPKVPVNLVYYEGDDEYPPRIQILYDATAIEVFKFEPLAVLNACFIAALTALCPALGQR